MTEPIAPARGPVDAPPRSPAAVVDDDRSTAPARTDLISAAELVALTHRPTLLDVRWSVAGGSDRAGFAAAHLPGAQFVDLNTDLAAPAGTAGRHPLPAPGELQATWRRFGLHDDSDVVVYDAADSSAAVRAWWLLRWSGLTRVRVLDGGLDQWGGPWEAGEPAAVPAGTLTVRPDSMPSVGLDRAATVAAGPGRTLLDARAPARFRGEIEPLDAKAGHIPGAVNLPYTALYAADGRLRPAEELRALFAAAGVRAGEPVVASCGSGVTACHVVLAGRVAGLNLALFPRFVVPVVRLRPAGGDRNRLIRVATAPTSPTEVGQGPGPWKRGLCCRGLP